MAKFYTHNALLGRAGVNLIERVVTAMGWVWNGTTIEAGIDGFIEIRDVVSGRGTNLIIQVQSKARTSFQRETADWIEFTCDERDLEYWLSGNAPVILVLSRPEVDEAYWIDVKTYFRGPNKRRDRVARFSKEHDRFGVEARERLQALAVPKYCGIYLAAPPRRETLYSNLVAVSRFAPTLCTASTACHDARAVRAKLGWDSPDEWIARGGRILSFCPLDRPEWLNVVESGTVEHHNTNDWAQATAVDRVNEFRELLHRALRASLRRINIHYFKLGEYFFFAASPDLSVRRVRYESFKKWTSRTVFQPFIKKGSDQVSYYRHSAFSAQFLRLGDCWSLAVVPTYHFTSDGWAQLRWYESRLQGIKRLERNNAVLGQVAMWAALLRGIDNRLFASEPCIRFGALIDGQLTAGINEAWWLWNEEDETTKHAASADLSSQSLFSDESGTV